MARCIGSVCKLCRREGEKLFLKGARCESAKCAIVKRNFQPGVHSWSRGRPSDFGVRLREKQKLKRFFGVSERQFRRVFAQASRQAGNTGENLLVLLQRRLDHLVTEMGITGSRRESRQWIAHGHVYVNGKRCDIPSAATTPGDVISVSTRENIRKLAREQREVRKGQTAPSWIQFDEAEMTAKVLDVPKRDHLNFPVDELLVVELMSK